MTVPESASQFVPSNLWDLISSVVTWINLNYFGCPCAGGNQNPQVPKFALEALVGIENVTSQDTPPSVVWVPLYDDGYEGPQDQPDYAHAIYQTNTVCGVYCWGNNLGEAEDLRNAVLTALWTLYSPAAVDTSRRAEYTKGLTSGELGVMIKMQIGLTIPIYDVCYGVVTIATFDEPPPAGTGTQGILVSDPPDFANPTPLPP